MSRAVYHHRDHIRYLVSVMTAISAGLPDGGEVSGEVGAGVGGTVIAAKETPKMFRSGGVNHVRERFGFSRRDIIGILNRQSGAVSYDSPGCDAPSKLTGNESRSYIITENTATCFSPFPYRLGRKCNVPNS